MRWNILVWFAILNCAFCAIFALKVQPRILTRDGHLSISVERHKNINLLVSGEGRIKVNNEDIVGLIKSLKNVSSLIDSLKNSNLQPSIPSGADNTNNQQVIPWDQDFVKNVNTLEQNFNNYTQKNDLSLTRIRRRLNIMQRNIRNMMMSLANNECKSYPCQNGGTCQDLYKAFLCICPKNWEGATCEKDVNECAIFAGTDLGCQNGASCINKPGSYECVCPIGFFGTHCTTKSIDCYASGHDLCWHGSCVPQAAGYKCICDQGWTTDGKNPACAVDVDECKSKQFPCSTNPLVQCINVAGSFYCEHCPPGYTGNGYYCNDIDECALFNGGCSLNPAVQCINTPGSRRCGLCPPGYIGDGVTCTYQGSVCNVNNGGCHPLAQCRDNPRISASYVECICPRSYVGNGIGANGCVQSSVSLNPCNPNPCVYGTCSINNVTNDYVCFCRLKYTGRNCNIRKDACLSNPCGNGGTCIDLFNLSYKCKCPAQFTGNNCQTERQSCGGKLEDMEGVLQFPLDPNQQYNHALSCAWVIQTNKTKVLKLEFTKFDVEEANECPYDWVQIHDGRNSAAHNIGRFCGSKLPKNGTIITTTNSVYIWFRSDSKLARYGFSLNWTTIDPVCGGTITATSYGTIHSPGYPGNYPLNRDCYWKIITDRTNRLEFHFFTLNIGQDVNCTGDYLEFYYDSVQVGNRFSQYCTTTHPPPLTSPSHNVIIYFHSNEKYTYSGFQISYKVVSGIPSCGGTFTTRSGVINNPVIPTQYQGSLFTECEYKISLENRIRVKLEFTSMKIDRYGSHCNEYVGIYDGPTKESPLVGKYCGQKIPTPFLSLGNEVLVVFYGKRSDTFTLRYNTVCGRKFTAPTGAIESPAISTARLNLECHYEIEQPPGKVITLTVVTVGRSGGLFFRVPRTTVTVRDGNTKESPLLATINSFTVLPRTVTSTVNYLTITAKSSLWFTSNVNYYMNYTTSDIGCGGIYTQDLGIIKSPNHPGTYPNEASCKWVIQAPSNHVVQLTFLNFKLELSNPCSYDYVALYDDNDKSSGNGFIERFCGSNTPPTLRSSSNAMRIEFKTDSSHSSDGFLASYVFIAEENICGGTYLNDAGVIKSPRYPEPYPVNRDCKWILHVKPGKQIMLNITDFQLESYSNCRYDFLEIRNGGTGASPLIGKYCGNTIPKIIYSHANQLYLHFKTDMTRNSKGFLIYWSSAATGCGGLLTSPSGSIISPHYPEAYSKNTECFWKISINAGSIIQVVFADLDLEPHLTCNLDYVEAFDGKDLSGKSLGKYCSTHPPYLRSTSNYMLIKFRSDVSFQGRGFQIQYSTVCHNTVTGFQGVIESPNFPNRYPQNEDCLWSIGVPQGNKINITFSHFELERSMSYTDPQKCNFDYVEFTYHDKDTEEEIKKIFCGETLPPPITISSNVTKVHFVSDYLLMGDGFRLEWQIFGCGGIFTHPSGTFESPNYPNHYPGSVRCDWIIQAPYGYSVAVSFQELDIEPTTGCNYDTIRIYNGPDDQSHLMNELCHMTKPITITSSANSMLVRFESDSSYEGVGFQGSYEFKASKCGGVLKADHGHFTSPNYPKNYDAGITCQWSIEIEDHHVIELTFQDVDLVKMGNYTYIKIYNGPSAAYPVLAFLLGDKTPNDTYKSTYNHMFVEMVTSDLSSLTAKGFQATYKTACGAILNSETSGVINYKPLQTTYNDLCHWIIMAPDPSQHVSLTISHTTGYYCDFEIHWISIYDGFNNSAPLIGTYCEVLPSMLTSTGSVLYIETNMGFKATYSTLSTACGGSLENERGYFATPKFPNNYPVNMECEWIVDISDTVTTGLTFESFDIVESEHCNDDFLEIRKGDNNGELIGVYCGTNAPTNVSAIGNLWLYFRSSKPDVGEVTTTTKGFKAEYFLVRHTELTKSSGTIYSPLYPEYYVKSEDFTWRITVKFGNAIAINIRELIMSFGNDDYCYSATISFYDGYDSDAPLLHQLCSKTVTSFTSLSNVMFIDANVDYSRRGVKFAIDWLEVPIRVNTSQPEKNTCGSTETININTLRNYTLQSPGYPNGYGHDLDCEWIFSTIPENHLQIDFYNVDLDYRFPCLYDRVEIYSGKNGVEDWLLLTNICLPNDTFRETIETTNLMKVVFKTDSYQNSTGFDAMITETCGGNVEKTGGVISVTNSTFSNLYSLRCQWNISVRTGRTIQIQFTVFDIGGNADSKCNNYILLRNGQSSSSPMLGDGKYCDATPPTLQTISNHLYVKFQTKTRVRGFTMKYKEVSVNCDATFSLSTLDNSTIISSPNYPNIPLPHTECKWVISAIPGESIQIDFVERFDLTDTPECDKEYVEIRDGGTFLSPLIGKYCESMPSTIVSRDNMIFIKFFTDIEEPRNGFKLRASIAKCGGTIRDTTGDIKSRYFNNKKSYPKKENCTWEIVGPEGHFIILSFDTLELVYTSRLCLVDYVEISEHSIIDYNNITSIGKYCYKNNNTDEIRTTSNKIQVRFITSDRNVPAAGFLLKFKTSKEKCGGSLENDFGIITSPRYPVIMFSTRCEWTIKVTKGKMIQVEILDLDFDTTRPSQGLAFSNSDNFAAHITFVKPNDKIKYINSTDNTMSVFFWAIHSSNHRGFKLRYTSDQPSICIADFSSPSGVIYSPQNCTYYHCIWKRVDSDASPRTLVLKISVSNANIPGISLLSSCKFTSSVTITAGKDDMMLGQFCTNKTENIVRNPFLITEIIANQASRAPLNFSISYRTYQCGGIITAEVGNITSPGYPKKTSTNVDCAWLIQLSPEQTINLKVDDMVLEGDCTKNYITIHNGKLNSSPRLKKYCHDTQPRVFRSQSNYLWIEYYSEANISSFKLSYEPVSTGCGGIFHDTNKIIQTPSYPEDYPNNAECIWEIRGELGYHIGLEFLERFHLEKTDGCQSDYVEVWDFINDNWYSLGRTCGRVKPNYLNSTSDIMKVEFRSNEKNTGSGFKAKWVLNCGGNFTATFKEQFIRSPGYPNKYKDNLDCWYNITAPGKHIIIKFEHFELEVGSPNCPYDSLTISYSLYGNLKTKTYCGSTKPQDITIKDAVSIRFKTDLFVRKSGFLFSYTTDECGYDITSPATVSSPDYTAGSPETLTKLYKCTWNITAPGNKVVAIKFDKIYTEDSRYCWYNYVALYDGQNSSREAKLATLCGNLTSTVPIIKSTKNKMVLTYRSYNSKINVFSASIYFTYGPAEGCGGIIPLDGKEKKTIENPNLEGPLDCQWIVDAPEDYYVKIDVQKAPSCRLTGGLQISHLEIRSGASHFAELLEDICNTIETVTTFTTAGSDAFIQWSTIDNKGGKDKFRFQVSAIKSSCGTTTLMATEEIKYIISPNFPNPYTDNIRCIWKINSTITYRHLALKVLSFDLGPNTDEMEPCAGDRLEIADKANRRVIDEGLGSQTVYYFGKKGTVHKAKRGPLGVHQYCGQTATEFDYYSGEGDVIVSFYSGSGQHGKGFKLEYAAVGTCRNYSSPQGRLYSNNITNCDFTITTPENTTISLYFIHFGMSSNTLNCTKNKMEVYDGAVNTATKLGSFCNYGLPNPIFSTSNKLLVRIVKQYYSFAYYDVIYTSTTQGRGCGGKIYNYKGLFTSPFYPNNYREISHCIWNVTVPYGLRISLKFTVFDIKAACYSDYVLVTTYRDDTVNTQTLCQTDEIPVFESINRIDVEYQTSFNNGGTGWVAEFRAVTEDETIQW